MKPVILVDNSVNSVSSTHPKQSDTGANEIVSESLFGAKPMQSCDLTDQQSKSPYPELSESEIEYSDSLSSEATFPPSCSGFTTSDDIQESDREPRIPPNSPESDYSEKLAAAETLSAQVLYENNKLRQENKRLLQQIDDQDIMLREKCDLISTLQQATKRSDKLESKYKTILKENDELRRDKLELLDHSTKIQRAQIQLDRSENELQSRCIKLETKVLELSSKLKSTLLAKLELHSKLEHSRKQLAEAEFTEVQQRSEISCLKEELASISSTLRRTHLDKEDLEIDLLVTLILVPAGATINHSTPVQVGESIFSEMKGQEISDLTLASPIIGRKVDTASLESDKDLSLKQSVLANNKTSKQDTDKGSTTPVDSSNTEDKHPGEMAISISLDQEMYMYNRSHVNISFPYLHDMIDLGTPTGFSPVEDNLHITGGCKQDAENTQDSFIPFLDQLDGETVARQDPELLPSICSFRSQDELPTHWNAGNKAAERPRDKGGGFTSPEIGLLMERPFSVKQQEMTVNRFPVHAVLDVQTPDPVLFQKGEEGESRKNTPVDVNYVALQSVLKPAFTKLNLAKTVTVC